MAIAAMKVPTIFYAVDRFSDVVTRMTAKTSAFGATAQAAAMRSSRAFNKAGTQMLTAGVGMAVGIGYAVNEAAKFEKSMSNISTLTENSPAQMKAMGDAILNMSKKMPVSLSDLTVGGYDVVSAGITGTANQLEVLKRSSILAVAGLGTTKEAVDITTSSLNAFGIEASRSEYATNLLMKAVKYGKTTVSGISESFGAFASIMKNSNVSLDEYLASAAALTTTGMSMSRAQTQVSSATTALIKPNKTMSAIYTKLGVKDVPTFIKKSGGLVGALQIVNDASKKMGLNLGKVMGRKEGLSALLSLLGSQKGKFNEIMMDMVSGADVVNTAFTKQQQTLSAKIQLMKNNLTVLAVKIGDVLIPRIKDLVGSIIPIVQNITAWSERNKGFANTLMTATKWLLILGAASKITAFLFYGLAKAIAFVKWAQIAYTTVTELCTVATYLAAGGQATFAASLMAVAGGLLAAYWPVLLVVAALGGLAYAFSSTSDSTSDMINSQVVSLSKGNMAWNNSTKVMQDNLNKQKSLNNSATQVAPLGTTRTISGNLAKDFGNKKAEQMSRAIKENSMQPEGQRYSADALKYAVNKGVYKFGSETSSPKNLAGKNNENAVMERFAAFAKKQQLDINLTAPDGYGATAESQDIKGIKVVTKPNQGNR